MASSKHAENPFDKDLISDKTWESMGAGEKARLLAATRPVLEAELQPKAQAKPAKTDTPVTPTTTPMKFVNIDRLVQPECLKISPHPITKEMARKVVRMGMEYVTLSQALSIKEPGRYWISMDGVPRTGGNYICKEDRTVERVSDEDWHNIYHMSGFSVSPNAANVEQNDGPIGIEIGYLARGKTINVIALNRPNNTARMLLIPKPKEIITDLSQEAPTRVQSHTYPFVSSQMAIKITVQKSTYTNAEPFARDLNCRLATLSEFIMALNSNPDLYELSKGNVLWVGDEPGLIVQRYQSINYGNGTLEDIMFNKWKLLPFEERAYTYEGKGPLLVHTNRESVQAILSVNASKKPSYRAQLALVPLTGAEQKRNLFSDTIRS